MKNRIRLWVAVAAALLSASTSLAETFDVDPAHTSVEFRVRHLFTTVTGRFESFDGKIVFDEKEPAKTRVEGSIDAATINTNVKKRDDHLRSADFFDVAKFPKITFQSASVSDLDPSGKKGKMDVLDASFLGKGKDPGGHERAGFHGTTTINRKDFGLTWNKALESGGLLLGDDVTIEIDVEGVHEG
jgi:polyisoprenoid-binding protein YceI